MAERFGNGLTTQFRINDRVMNFLIDISPKVINFDEGITNLAREFKKVSTEIFQINFKCNVVPYTLNRYLGTYR